MNSSISAGRLESSTERKGFPRLGIYNESEFTLQSCTSPKSISSRQDIFITTLKKKPKKLDQPASSARIRLPSQANLTEKELAPAKDQVAPEESTTFRLPHLSDRQAHKLSAELSSDLAEHGRDRKSDIFGRKHALPAHQSQDKLTQSLAMHSPGFSRLTAVLKSKEEDSENDKLSKIFSTQLKNRSRSLLSMDYNLGSKKTSAMIEIKQTKIKKSGRNSPSKTPKVITERESVRMSNQAAHQRSQNSRL